MKSEASPSSPCRNDDGPSFAAIDDVQCGVLDVDAAAVDVDGCIACRGASEERDHGGAAGQDDHQYPISKSPQTPSPEEVERYGVRG